MVHDGRGRDTVIVQGRVVLCFSFFWVYCDGIIFGFRTIYCLNVGLQIFEWVVYVNSNFDMWVLFC